MAGKTDKTDLLIFPDDLNEKRYISFDFYAPEFAKEVVGALSGVLDAGITLVSAATGNGGTVSGAVGTAVTAAKSGASALGKAFDKSAARFTISKDSSGNSSISGDIATQGIEKSSKTYKGTIFLPISNSLSEGLSNDYDGNSGGAAANILGKASGVADVLNEVSTFTGTRSLLINPDFVQNYKGSGLRSLDLEWTLMPNNQQETKKILEIINTFKKFSSPETQAAKALLLSPYFCVVTFNNPILDDSLRLEEMVITSIDVNYGGGMSNMEMFSDGMVKQITLSVKLGERRMKTMEDWAESRESREFDKVRNAGGLFDQASFTEELDFNA